MNAEESSQAEQIQSQQSKDLTQLRKQIQLTNIQLLQLVYNESTSVIIKDKFIEHVNNLNSKGIECLNNEYHKQAMIYFSQNQRILQYVASCGKTIDRSVIVSTLHNQACVNQKLWDLQKSANYLQAIIYNMSYYFQNVNKVNNFQNFTQKNQQFLDDLATFIQKKQMFALYHLQFCAVNSRIRRHTISNHSAKTAITIMKEVSHLSYLLSQKIIYNDVIQMNQARQNSQILNQLSESAEQLQIKDFKKNFKAVKTLITNDSHHQASQDQFKNIRNFSIGKLMHLTPLSIVDMQAKWPARLWLKQQNIFNMALYMGVCYFTVGTQLRFISSQKNQQNNQQYKISQQFLMSQVYHIYSIMIVMKFVPERSIFLNHLLSSFNNHYEIDLERVATDPNFQQNGNDQLIPQSQQINNNNHISSQNQPLIKQNNIQNIEHKLSQYEMSVDKKTQQNKRQQQIITVLYHSKSDIQKYPQQKQLKILKNKHLPHILPRTNSTSLKKIPTTSKQKKMKTQISVNLSKKLLKQSIQKIQKNKQPKSKSKQKKYSFKCKKSNQKISIYTVRNKLDQKKPNNPSKKPHLTKPIQKSLKQRIPTTTTQQKNPSQPPKKSSSKQKFYHHQNQDKNKFKNSENKINNQTNKSKNKYHHQLYKMNKVLPTNDKKTKCKI